MPQENKRDSFEAAPVRQAARLLSAYVTAIQRGLLDAQERHQHFNDIRELVLELPDSLVAEEEIPEQIMAKSCAGIFWRSPGSRVELGRALEDMNALSSIICIGLSGLPDDARFPLPSAEMGGTS